MTAAPSSPLEQVMLAARLMRPYLARGLSALMPVERPGLGTVAVDEYWRLYYDPEWLFDLPLNQAATVIADHELSHLLRNHAHRCKRIAVNPRVWNIAGDAEINDDIPADTLPPDHVRPSALGAPDHLTAEEYLDYIPRVSVKAVTCAGGSGAGAPIPDELPLDDRTHPGIPDAVAEQLRDEIAADIRKHIHDADPSRGDVPEHLRVWAESRLPPPKPEPPWYTKLRASIARTSREIAAGRTDYTWARLPRRSTSGILRPGSITYRPRFAVLMDTSGSMSDAGHLVMAQLAAILHDSPDLWETDASDVPRRVRRRNPTFTGGGGTDLRGAITALTARYDALIVITDGETPWPHTPPPIPVTVVLTAAASSPPPAHYHTIHAHRSR